MTGQGPCMSTGEARRLHDPTGWLPIDSFRRRTRTTIRSIPSFAGETVDLPGALHKNDCVAGEALASTGEKFKLVPMAEGYFEAGSRGTMPGY